MRLFFAFVAVIACAISMSASANLAFDDSGNLFFEGRNTDIIVKYAPDGTKTTFATGTKDTPINGDLAVDASGNVFACANFTTILKYAPDGSRSVFATGVGKYWPNALAVDAAGNLFVSSDNTISKFTPGGTKSAFATGIEAYGLAFDQAGNLFASDNHGENGHLVSAIVKFAPDGTKSTFANMHGYGLAFDKSGNLFVSGEEGILKFTPDGTKSTFAKADASEGLAFDAAGNLIGCDGNNRIFKLTPGGTKTAFSSKPPESGAADENGEDTSAGLPARYAKDYLVASNTTSPDKKFAVIYPKEAVEDAASEKGTKIKNYLVRLEPFVVVRPLDTKRPYFEHQSHGGLSAEWSDDSSVGLIILDSKWGPGDVLLVEFQNGELTRMTNILRKAHDLLLPNYRKAKAERYNDDVDFVFMEDASFKLEGTSRVVIDAEADTTPNDLGLSKRAWHGHVEATWDIAQAKFTSEKVSGQRRGADAHRIRGQSAAEDRRSSPEAGIQNAIGFTSKGWDYYLSLAWYHLFDQNPREAIAASLKALELSPHNAAMVKVTLAHSYLFDHQFDKAKAIYLENKNAKLRDDERTFNQAVLDDFKELQQAGITNPDVDKIKVLLTTNQEGI